MLSTFDDAYLETRRVLEGLSEPKAPYKALTAWIAEQSGGANVLNAVYEMTASRPCLTVVMERDSDVAGFAGGEPGTRAVHAQIASRLREILAEQRNERVVTENILVIVSAFAPTNRIEANHKVPPEAISDFQNKLADRSIWLIKPNFEYLRVFFNAESDVAVSERSGFREQIAKQYQAVIAPYDDFGYVRETPIELVFDSRERFDRVYKGNWFGYDRDNP